MRALRCLMVIVTPCSLKCFKDMKKKEIQELKNKQPGELSRIVSDSNERLRALRFDLAAGKVKNVNELRTLRKNIARMQTFIREDKNVTK